MRHRAETIETIEKISIETIEYGADAPLPALRHQHQHPPLPRGFADVHMHTNYSDGTGSVEDVLRFAQEHTRLDVIAITDHDTIEGALRARDLAARDDYRFEVIVGEEISTREGHMLALFLEHPVAPDQSIERSIEQVHAQGGLAIVAHPFNRVFRHSVQRSVMNRLLRQPELHPDGIETLNGSFAGIGSSKLAMALARSVYHWAETGGSDAHTPTAVGCARTVFPGRTAADLRHAIAQRETSPLGAYWRAREYVSFVSHRVRYGGAATTTFEEQVVRETRVREGRGPLGMPGRLLGMLSRSA
ncbi:MAG TPA: CehA/McbA family metallohydrolase [Ktedonobacterales bacterium]|nr:CehA/McbA family metallohydrolase [Ktedonobacterales bacterium]